MADKDEKKDTVLHDSKHEAKGLKDVSSDLLAINDDFVKEMLEIDSRGKQEVFSHGLQTQSDATSLLNDSQPALSTYDLSSGVDNDSNSVCCESNPSQQWRGGVQGLNAPIASCKFDQVSSLKMTYYAFKDANVQKSGVPVSMLTAHIERKESRYPSFLGSRGSVSMGGGSSPGAWRTLQRSPSRKASFDTYPILAPQVLEVIRSLEEHQKKCENEGNYMAAQSAVQRLHGIKLLEDNKRKAAMIQRHLKERDEVEEAYKSEIDERNRLWDEKLHLFHKGVVEHAAKLKRQQIGILQAFRAKMAAKVPNKPQWSKELLKHRKVQNFLAKQGKYLEAQEVKRITDRMEHLELQGTLAAYQAEVNAKEQALRAKQQSEMEVLLQRAAQGRDELQKTRVQDLERCNQRHANIVRELKASQKQQCLKFEAILAKRVTEFKHMGGNFQFLSQSINSNYGSLCLSNIVDCSEDEDYPNNNELAMSP